MNSSVMHMRKIGMRFEVMDLAELWAKVAVCCMLLWVTIDQEFRKEAWSLVTLDLQSAILQDTMNLNYDSAW